MRTVSPAARQLAALLWLLTSTLVAYAWHAGTPMPADALAPRLQQAHAFAAETARLARQSAEGSLPAPVSRRHAALLLDHVRRATRALADARVENTLVAHREAARPPLLAVERELEQLAAGRRADRGAVERASDALQAQARAVAAAAQ